MKAKTTYSKDAFLHIRVDKADLRRWKQRAAQWDSTLTGYAIRALNHMDRFAIQFDPPPKATGRKRV